LSSGAKRRTAIPNSTTKKLTINNEQLRLKSKPRKNTKGREGIKFFVLFSRYLALLAVNYSYLFQIQNCRTAQFKMRSAPR
jgi:hypothetical protein